MSTVTPARPHSPLAEVFVIRPMNSSTTAAAAAVLLPLLLLGPGKAIADDASTGVAPPRISLAPDDLAAPTQRQIQLDGRHVRVSLALAGAGGSTRRGKVSMPSFEWRGEGDPYPDRHYPELAVRVDGRTVRLQDDFRAATAKGDITDTLRAAGIDPFVIADSPPIVDIDKLSPSQAQALQVAGALKVDPDAGDLAMWSAQREVTFDLPAVRRSVLVVSYLARPAFDLRSTTDADLDPKLRSACTSTASLRQKAADILNGESVVAEAYVFDVAASAAPRGAPVALELHAEAGAPKTVYATCSADGRGLVGLGRLSARGVVGPDGLVRVVALSSPALPAKR